MALSKGTQNFWNQIGFILLISALVGGVLVRWLGWGAIAVALLVSLFWLRALLGDLKGRMLRGLPDQWQISPINLQEVPALNLAWLNQQMSTLEAQGFVKLMDYQLLGHQAVSSFGRCCAHPQQHCFVEIGQVFSQTIGETISNLVILSTLDQGWSLATVNREPRSTDSITLLWWDPKSVVICDPNPNLEQFFQAHLQFRQKMMADLEVSLATDNSWESFCQIQQKSTTYRKQALQNRNLLAGMLQVTWSELHPTFQRLGDYPKMAKVKTQKRIS